MLQRIGGWAFIVGVIVAVVLPIFAGLSVWLTSLLIVLGLDARRRREVAPFRRAAF